MGHRSWIGRQVARHGLRSLFTAAVVGILLCYGLLLYRTVPSIAPTDEFNLDIERLSSITGLTFPSGRVLLARHRQAGLVGSSGLWAVVLVPASDLTRLREQTSETDRMGGVERSPEWGAVFRAEEIPPSLWKGIRELRQPVVVEKGYSFAEGRTVLLWDAQGSEQRRVYVSWWEN